MRLSLCVINQVEISLYWGGNFRITGDGTSCKQKLFTNVSLEAWSGGGELKVLVSKVSKAVS
jgi:hypothetical protein